MLRGPGLEKIPAEQLAGFADAVRESTIPFLVETRDWARLPERFRREIEGHHVVLSYPLARSVDWPIPTLRDAGVQLIDCVHKTPAAQESGYPYIGIPQMKSGRLDFESARKISHEDFVDWTKKAKAQPHDVILSRRTNPGVTAIDRTGTEFALGQNLVLLRADGSRVDPAFLKWLVRSPAWWREIGKFINVGAVFDSLRCADVPNFELPIPPLAVQLRIAEILDSLHDKIELNRRMNDTLEAMARALFKSWFVDFEPVRAKMNGRDIGLPDHITDLFPDALVDEHKTAGWSMDTLAADWLRGIQNLGLVKDVPEQDEYVDRRRLQVGHHRGYAKVPLEGRTPAELDVFLDRAALSLGRNAPVMALLHSLQLAVSLGALDSQTFGHSSTTTEEFVFLAATAPENIERLVTLGRWGGVSSRPSPRGGGNASCCSQRRTHGHLCGICLSSPRPDRVQQGVRTIRSPKSATFYCQCSSPAKSACDRLRGLWRRSFERPVPHARLHCSPWASTVRPPKYHSEIVGYRFRFLDLEASHGVNQYFRHVVFLNGVLNTGRTIGLVNSQVPDDLADERIAAAWVAMAIGARHTHARAPSPLARAGHTRQAPREPEPRLVGTGCTEPGHSVAPLIGTTRGCCADACKRPWTTNTMKSICRFPSNGRRAGRHRWHPHPTRCLRRRKLGNASTA